MNPLQTAVLADLRSDYSTMTVSALAIRANASDGVGAVDAAARALLKAGLVVRVGGAYRAVENPQPVVVITAADVLRVLRSIRLGTTAACVADLLGCSSRAVATAARSLVEAGQVSMRFPRKGQCIALYRFVRLKPRAPRVPSPAAAWDAVQITPGVAMGNSQWPFPAKQAAITPVAKPQPYVESNLCRDMGHQGVVRVGVVVGGVNSQSGTQRIALTPWSGAGVEPVHVGVYEVKMTDSCIPWYSLWDGDGWRLGGGTPARAWSVSQVQRHARLVGFAANKRQWRGLALPVSS